MTSSFALAAEVVGIDADSKILGIARAKAAKAGIKLRFDQGTADQLPYADSSFDRVLSSLFLHHLSTENKLRTLREVFRVLRSDGRFDVVDFGPPRTFYSRLVARITVKRSVRSGSTDPPQVVTDFGWASNANGVIGRSHVSSVASRLHQDYNFAPNFPRQLKLWSD